MRNKYEATDIGARYRLDCVERRLDANERNVASHECAIGDNSGRISLVEQLDIAYEHLRRDAGRIETLESAAKAGEMRLELNARRIEEIADKTAQRLDGHRTQLDGITEHFRTIERIALKRPLDENIGLTDKVAALEEQLHTLGRKYTADKMTANQLRNGPKSYDKRLETLEKKDARLRDIIFGIANDTACRHDKRLAERIAAIEAAVGEDHQLRSDAVDTTVSLILDRLQRLESAHAMRSGQLEARIEALESGNDDPLRRVPGVYNGTGDDATGGDCDYCIGVCDCGGTEITAEEQRSIDRHADEEMARAQLEREHLMVHGREKFGELDDPASRDGDTASRVISAALRRALALQHESLIDAGVDRQEALNRVVLRKREFIGMIADELDAELRFLAEEYR